jgi:hypothetical protein
MQNCIIFLTILILRMSYVIEPGELQWYFYGADIRSRKHPS